MLSRITSLLAVPVASLVDICTLGFLAVWQGTTAIISDGDWDKITGPHGLVFVLIIALTVVWTKSVRDDASRERRHRESIRTQQDHFDALLELNEKSSKDLRVLTVASTEAQITATNAIMSMDRNISRLAHDVIENGKITQKQLELCRLCSDK